MQENQNNESTKIYGIYDPISSTFYTLSADQTNNKQIQQMQTLLLLIANTQSGA